MELNLKGKVAIVTGGARGLGRAICLRLAAEGVHVVVNYNRSGVEAASLLEEIRDRFGIQALAIQGDVSQEQDILELFNEAEEQFPRLDLLVNNAGICPISIVRDLSGDVWNRTIGTNLTGTFLASREMVRRLMARARPGRIINIVSPAAFMGSENGKSHYAASKAGVVAFTVSLAREVAANGIVVNAVAPGMMHTDMTSQSLEAAAEHYRRTIPLGRLASPEEMAESIVFLASEKNSYMTGATVDLSGGLLMR